MFWIMQKSNSLVNDCFSMMISDVLKTLMVGDDCWKGFAHDKNGNSRDPKLVFVYFSFMKLDVLVA